MLNNKPGQASRKLAQTTHTHTLSHTQEQQQNAITCTAYFGADSGAGADAAKATTKSSKVY